MSSASAEPVVWPRILWCLAVALVVALQVGLVFWLSDRAPNRLPSVVPAPAVFLAKGALARLPLLADPLQFSPANPDGFSGKVWWKSPKLDYQLSDWAGPPSWLNMPVEQLGSAFSRILSTNNAGAFIVANRPEPQLSSPVFSLPESASQIHSTFKIEGELELRPLIQPLMVPDLPATNLISRTVVQVVVDQDGNTVSAIVLSKSGSEEADKKGLNLAKATRYRSIRINGSGQTPVGTLGWGRMIFDWHIVPLVVKP